MNAIRRPIMRYFGGKFGNSGTLADRIVGSLPVHRVYVEPYGGAASVLMRKPRSYAEVYNEKADHVVAVFRVLRDAEKAEKLRRSLTLTPFSRTEFKACAGSMEGLDDIEIARRVIFRAMAGFGSAAANPNYDTGFRSNSNRSHTTPAHDWKNYPPLIVAFVTRLQGVVIENKDALEVMRQHDADTTLHYVDPPYVHETRCTKTKREYVFEMTDEEHRALAACLHSLKGMVVLSGYASALYAELFPDWECVSLKSVADGARPRVEKLWFNPSATRNRKLPLE